MYLKISTCKPKLLNNCDYLFLLIMGCAKKTYKNISSKFNILF